MMWGVLGAWFFADFLSGVAHWWEDRCLVAPQRWAWLESIRIDNVKHHRVPGYLTTEGMWGNINTTAPLTIPLTLALWLVGSPTWIWLALFFVTFGNYVHRLSHDGRCSRLVKILQWSELFIPPEQHSVHHYSVLSGRLLTKEESRDSYCVMTGYLNPILDSVGFWRKLERVFRI